MVAYYNEYDEKKAAWLRELIKQNVIAPGVVDERSILDVRPDELTGFTQVHLCAGIGIWSYALRLAGWDDSRPVWTVSEPCQPHSAAGKGLGDADERYIRWAIHHHVEHGKLPDIPVYGEQVANGDGLAWLDTLCADMEGAGHTVRAFDLCAAGFGCPGIRQRLYWVANTDNTRHEGNGLQPLHGGRESGGEELRATRSSPALGLADSHDPQRRADGARRNDAAREASERQQSDGDASECGEPQRLAHTIGERGCSGEPGGEDAADAWKSGESRRLAHSKLDEQRTGGGAGSQSEQGNEPGIEPSGCGAVGGVGNAEHHGLAGHALAGSDGEDVQHHAQGKELPFEPSGTGRPLAIPESSSRTHPGAVNGFWRTADWLRCRDGSWRPVESGTFPLASGVAARVLRLRGYGDGINAQQAAHFIKITEGFLNR